jgi:hypothetical protein
MLHGWASLSEFSALFRSDFFAVPEFDSKYPGYYPVDNVMKHRLSGPTNVVKPSNPDSGVRNVTSAGAENHRQFHFQLCRTTAAPDIQIRR